MQLAGPGHATDWCDGDMSLAGDINSFLESVTRNYVPIMDRDKFGVETNNKVPDKFIICVDDVELKMARINVNKSIGPENTPQLVSCLLTPPVCAVFNSSLREAVSPTTWKSAYIRALPKVNPPTQLEKHIRSISLTPVLAKVYWNHLPAGGLWGYGPYLSRLGP